MAVNTAGYFQLNYPWVTNLVNQQPVPANIRSFDEWVSVLLIPDPQQLVDIMTSYPGWFTEVAAGAMVTSFWDYQATAPRTGAVTAQAGDYPASYIDNDSANVIGATVADALDTLFALLGSNVYWVEPVQYASASPPAWSDGERCLVSGTGTGIFAGHDYEIATATAGGTAATFEPMVDGAVVSLDGSLLFYRYNGVDLDALQFATVFDFTDLGDAPASYAGEALKLVRVNAGETGLEFVAAGGGTGDVVGPASSINNGIVLFDGVTGKLIKDSALTLPDLIEEDPGSGIGLIESGAGVVPFILKNINGVQAAGIQTIATTGRVDVQLYFTGQDKLWYGSDLSGTPAEINITDNNAPGNENSIPRTDANGTLHAYSATSYAIVAEAYGTGYGAIIGAYGTGAGAQISAVNGEGLLVSRAGGAGNVAAFIGPGGGVDMGNDCRLTWSDAAARLATILNLLNGAALTAATVSGTDKVLIQDADDSDSLKTVTAQSIADLAAGGGSSMTLAVSQASHGLSVGDVVRHNGTGYVDAQANSATNAEVVGIVSAVADASNFTLHVGGVITTLSGLTAGTTYFLDPSTAGAYTATEPSTVGQVSKPLFTAVSTTSAIWTNYRGIVIV